MNGEPSLTVYVTYYYVIAMIIDHIALGKQEDNRIGSIRPSVCQ